MLYVGVDPGKSGAVVVLGALWNFSACRLSLPHSDVYNWLSERISGQPSTAYLEHVHARPNDSRHNAFTFGTSYGACQMLLAALIGDYQTVSPQKWQKAMDCRTGGDKRISRSRARQLFPHLKISHWNADAFLIAEYARRTHEGGHG